MIDYNEHWLFSVVCRRGGSVAPRALWFALPAACFAPLLLLLDELVPDFREGVGLEAVISSVLWASTTSCVLFLVGFRSRQALGRFWEGTGLLHQMRAEWFDAASCLMTFSRGARATKPKEVDEFRHVLVRLMSLMHGSALEEIKAESRDIYEVIDIRGLDAQTRSYLKECKNSLGFDRVEVLLHMVQVLVMQNLDDGVIKVAPIVTRVFQTLSRGFVNLLNAKKLKSTKFPFPYVQLVDFLLIFHALLTPVVIATIIPHKVWAAVFSFMPVFGLLSLNFIAIELEVPYGDDANDLPLKEFQKEMNTSLLMLISDDADRLVSTSSNVLKSCQSLTAMASFSSCSAGTGSESKNAMLSFASLTGWGASSAGTPTCEKSIFDTDDLSAEAVEENQESADKASVDQLPMSRDLPPVYEGRGRDEEEETNEKRWSCESAGEESAGKNSVRSDEAVVRPRLFKEMPFVGNTAAATNFEASVEEPRSTRRSAPGRDRFSKAAETFTESLVLDGRTFPDSDDILIQWHAELHRNTEALKLLAAAVPQLAGHEPHALSGALLP